eukprot:Lankesteria_metandrocarpae@DN4313_c0_g1_i1.p1
MRENFMRGLKTHLRQPMAVVTIASMLIVAGAAESVVQESEVPLSALVADVAAAVEEFSASFFATLAAFTRVCVVGGRVVGRVGLGGWRVFEPLVYLMGRLDPGTRWFFLSIFASTCCFLVLYGRGTINTFTETVRSMQRQIRNALPIVTLVLFFEVVPYFYFSLNVCRWLHLVFILVLPCLCSMLAVLEEHTTESSWTDALLKRLSTTETDDIDHDMSVPVLEYNKDNMPSMDKFGAVASDLDTTSTEASANRSVKDDALSAACGGAIEGWMGAGFRAWTPSLPFVSLLPSPSISRHSNPVSEQKNAALNSTRSSIVAVPSSPMFSARRDRMSLSREMLGGTYSSGSLGAFVFGGLSQWLEYWVVVYLIRFFLSFISVAWVSVFNSCHASKSPLDVFALLPPIHCEKDTAAITLATLLNGSQRLLEFLHVLLVVAVRQKRVNVLKPIRHYLCRTIEGLVELFTGFRIITCPPATPRAPRQRTIDRLRNGLTSRLNGIVPSKFMWITKVLMKLPHVVCLLLPSFLLRPIFQVVSILLPSVWGLQVLENQYNNDDVDGDRFATAASERRAWTKPAATWVLYFVLQTVLVCLLSTLKLLVFDFLLQSTFASGVPLGLHLQYALTLGIQLIASSPTDLVALFTHTTTESINYLQRMFAVYVSGQEYEDDTSEDGYDRESIDDDHLNSKALTTDTDCSTATAEQINSRVVFSASPSEDDDGFCGYGEVLQVDWSSPRSLSSPMFGLGCVADPHLKNAVKNESQILTTTTSSPLTGADKRQAVILNDKDGHSDMSPYNANRLVARRSEVDEDDDSDEERYGDDCTDTDNDNDNSGDSGNVSELSSTVQSGASTPA